ncbi:hypothetical protein MKX03_021873 [Papaver bracteatum]|nr:hypothetical protein MKX03_021873 [Papaver bracteatum]
MSRNAISRPLSSLRQESVFDSYYNSYFNNSLKVPNPSNSSKPESTPPRPWKPIFIEYVPEEKPIVNTNYNQLLRCCTDLKSLLQIHAQLLVSGYKSDSLTDTHLVQNYSLFGKPDFARFVFNKMESPTTISYNSMIRGYTRMKQYRNAMLLYHKMLFMGVEPDRYTFVITLRACMEAYNVDIGFLIHEEMVKNGFDSDVFVVSALIEFYFKMGKIDAAEKAFENMPEPDVAVCNAMIKGYSLSVKPFEALRFFHKMQREGIEVNSESLLNLVPAVSKLASVRFCRAFHGVVTTRGFSRAFLNGLIDMYSKCGDVLSARSAFYRMRGRNDVSWGTVMESFVSNGWFGEALGLFDCIKRERLKLIPVSAVSALLAAAEVGNVEKAREIHDYFLRAEAVSDIRSLEKAREIQDYFVRLGIDSDVDRSLTSTSYRAGIDTDTYWSSPETSY